MVESVRIQNLPKSKTSWKIIWRKNCWSLNEISFDFVIPMRWIRKSKKLKELAIEASKKKDFASCHCPWKLKKYGKAIALDSKEIIYYNNSAAVCFQMNLWTILTYASSFATKKIEPNQNSSSKVLKEWDDPSWKTRPIFAKMSSLLSIYVTHVYYLTKIFFDEEKDGTTVG